MKRSEYILSVLILLFFGIFPLQAQPTMSQIARTTFHVKINGKIEFCGKSDYTSTLVRFKTRAKDTTLSQITAESDGSFALNANCEDGQYELCASHPDCMPLHIPIYVDSNFTTDVALRFNYYETKDTAVVFRYGEKQYSLNKTAIATKGSDNIWRAKVKLPSSEIFYQVFGDEKTGRTHCPSRYEKTLPDKDGDLIGVLPNKHSDSVTLEYSRKQQNPCEVKNSASFSNSTLEYRNQVYSQIQFLMGELRVLRNKSEIPQWIELSHKTLNVLDSTINSVHDDGYVLALLLKAYTEVATIGWFTKQPKYKQELLERMNLQCQRYPDIWALDLTGAFPSAVCIYDNEKEIKKHIALILASRTLGNDVKSEILCFLDEVYTHNSQPMLADECRAILLGNYIGTTGYDALMDRLKSNSEDSTLIGKEMMKIETTNISGKGHVVSHNDYHGKYILLDFWATWCKPCIEEMEYLKKAKNTIDSNRFQIVGVSFDDNLDKVKPFVQKKNIPWDIFLISPEAKKSVVNFYSAEAIPRPILISPQGVIIAVGEMLRGEKLQETLERIIK